MSTFAGRFSGKTGVVTGAAQGIGKAVALRFAAEGGAVVLVDRSELADDVRTEIEAHGGTALTVTSDLETYAGAEAAMRAAKERFGRIDVLVNNVGGTIWAMPYAEYAGPQIEAEIRRSLFPTLWCCRAVLPAMLEAGNGVIVNVSSIATRGIHRVPYAAAKGGVNAITACLAFEYAEHNIRVCGVAPGGIDAPPRRIPRSTSETTELGKARMREVMEQTMASTLMKRLGTPEEEAAAILFLASDDASYITGVTLPVAGGDLG